MLLDPHRMPEAPSHSARFLQLESGTLHEIYAAAPTDAACLAGCALMMARTVAAGSCLWVRHVGQGCEAGEPSPLGLAELGLDPARVLLLLARHPAEVLQAALEGARCSGLGTVVVELRGETKTYDLTASRRLVMASAASGTRVLLTRIAAAPRSSAAHMRWQVRTLPSRPLAAQAPGVPTFELILLRARNRQEGLRYCVEWDRDARQFVARSDLFSGNAAVCAAPVSGVVAPFPFDRQDKAGGWRQAG